MSRAGGRNGGGSKPSRGGFVWRGIQFSALPDGPGLYGSATIELEGERPANWRCERLASTRWHARLKIGADRFPGVGKTHTEALDAAAAEASTMQRFVAAMVPAASSPQVFPACERSQIIVTAVAPAPAAPPRARSKRAPAYPKGRPR